MFLGYEALTCKREVLGGLVWEYQMKSFVLIANLSTTYCKTFH